MPGKKKGRKKAGGAASGGTAGGAADEMARELAVLPEEHWDYMLTMSDEESRRQFIAGGYDDRGIEFIFRIVQIERKARRAPQGSDPRELGEYRSFLLKGPMQGQLTASLLQKDSPSEAAWKDLSTLEQRVLDLHAGMERASALDAVESALGKAGDSLEQGPERARAREAKHGTEEGALAFALIQATVSGNLPEAKALVQRRGADPNVAMQVRSSTRDA